MADFARVPHRDLRVADADRDAAAQALGEHYAVGRLESAEYDERLSAAWRAKTYGDLDMLFRDLPRPHPGFPASMPAAPSPPPKKNSPRWVEHLRGAGDHLKSFSPVILVVIAVSALLLKGPGLMIVLLLLGWWCWGATTKNHHRR